MLNPIWMDTPSCSRLEKLQSDIGFHLFSKLLTQSRIQIRLIHAQHIVG